MSSLPVWEEWIEMHPVLCIYLQALSLFPYGKSGLKLPLLFAAAHYLQSLPVWEEWIEICRILAIWQMKEVSSRMGRVD